MNRLEIPLPSKSQVMGDCEKIAVPVEDEDE